MYNDINELKKLIMAEIISFEFKTTNVIYNKILLLHHTESGKSIYSRNEVYGVLLLLSTERKVKNISSGIRRKIMLWAKEE